MQEELPQNRYMHKLGRVVNISMAERQIEGNTLYS
jgi:hypothetical protein